MLKDNHAGLQQPDDLKNAMVSGILPGTNVPLRQIADVKPDWNEGMIVRRNGITTVSVMADIRRGVNLNKETDKILEQISATKLPTGVKMTAGGQRASDNEFNPQIYGGLCISVVIIFLILLLHFKNIRMSLLIMYSLSFSLVGLSIGMLIMKQDMGVTAILGIISLMGIIVRNGIIMIDYSEELRVKRHITAKHAALQAAQRRLRPIFLTSAAASMGVVPMVIQNSPMWGPMGTVVCFGTLISMLFIITMIPIGYWMIFRLQDKKRKLKNEKERSSKMLSEI
jgi:multidrug efflux pump subunit AcrB